ncbi:MAG: type II toxin-antitoxin system VapC family toxin [Myxococcota bacterium]|nr:type II toxin-antitoxin system VapC family toxin [Myxococcota bacterium]
MSGRREREKAAAVLDASALLAVLSREEGYRKILPLLGRALISTVNLSEVLSKVPPDELERERQAILLLGVRAVPFDEHDAVRTAGLRTLAPELSLGDRACLALGIRLELPVWTADRAWSKVATTAVVRQIRAHLKPPKG